MARYDKKKKTQKPKFFIIPVFLAILILIFGSFFAVKRIMNKKETPAKAGTKDTPSLGAPLSTEPVSDSEKIILPRIIQPNKTATTIPGQAKKIQLPDLLSSDDVVRKEVSRLSPGLAPWLAVDQVIRRYTVIVNDFAQNIRVGRHMSFFRLDQPFSVMYGGGTDLYIAPKNFQRFDVLTRAIQVIDAKEAVKLFQIFRPLVQQVFNELGYPKNVTLETVIGKAINEIIAAPVIEEPIGVVRPSMFYKFADPQLEALGPVQKQMIRMGPQNTRIIQVKCREFLVELAKVKNNPSSSNATR